MASREPVLLEAVIGAANSALYGRRSAVKTVREAVAYMGTNTARNILLGTALRPWMQSDGLEDMWRHCLASGFWCQQVAAATGIVKPEQAMLAGLVHDLGLVAMRYLSSEVVCAYDRLRKGGCPPAYAEMILLGSDHGEMGAEILAGWKFDDSLIDAVRWHHQPERSRGPLAGLIYLSEFWHDSEEDLPSPFDWRQLWKPPG